MDHDAVIEGLVQSVFPGARLRAVEPLSPDATGTGATAKASGYGQPRRISLVDGEGRERVVVLRSATANEFGHDRPSDRAQQALLAFDTFGLIPDHVRALDVGAVRSDGTLVSLRDAGELYLLTTWAPGHLYADELRRIAEDGTVTGTDVAHCDALVRYLLDLHRPEPPDAVRYRRAIRDLVGHGEGIFGIVDSYPADVPAAPPARLRAIEERAAGWRWRLRDRESRLVRVHGDFHPFNVVFGDGDDGDGGDGDGDARFTLLDASRGCLGDAADDVTAMAVNYPFFALERPASWAHGLGVLWRRFWHLYLGQTPDPALLEVVPPFLAWRGLVVANPRFYPRLAEAARDQLLTLVERALAAGRLDPGWAEELFPGAPELHA